VFNPLNIVLYECIGLYIKKGSGNIKLGIRYLQKDAIEKGREFNITVVYNFFGIIKLFYPVDLLIRTPSGVMIIRFSSISFSCKDS